jgi:hypothetical protein
MTVVKVFCSHLLKSGFPRAAATISGRHFSPQLIAALPVYRPHRAM